MCSKDEILKRLNDTLYCDSLGFKPERRSSPCLFRMYDILLNISPDKLMKRMKHEYMIISGMTARGTQAQQIGLSPLRLPRWFPSWRKRRRPRMNIHWWQAFISIVFILECRCSLTRRSNFAVGDFSIAFLFEHLRSIHLITPINM